jgi:2-phosphosulfolactate phosphatase
MADDRDVHVYLLPSLVPAGRLQGGLALVIDVLRATTTIVHALAAGCRCIRPVAEIDEARLLAASLSGTQVLLAGERGGRPIEGFDLGNSPGEYKARICKNKTLVFTTSNGTRALLRAAEAERVLAAAFVNYSPICEQLRTDLRPLHILCAGTEGEVSLEDTLLAGALVDFVTRTMEVRLDDGARLAWDCFENQGQCIQGALEVSRGGAILRGLGYHEDIRAACQVDRFALVPELKRDPLRVELATVGIVENHWQRAQHC